MRIIRTIFIVVLCAASLASAAIRVASFNIRIFGRMKMRDEVSRETIVEILSRYDLIAVQEVRDSSETAARQLLTLLKGWHPDYRMEISGRLGRTTSKEQYAFFYRSTKMDVSEAYQLEDDGDEYQREPFCIRVQPYNTDLLDFWIMNVHTEPSAAAKEVSLLRNKAMSAIRHYDLENGVIVGDFNADCTYVTRRKWNKIALWTDKEFTWFIDGDQDTTVGSTDCAYDRIVTIGKEMTEAVSDSAVFDFEVALGLTHRQALAVSDHYPIEMTIH